MLLVLHCAVALWCAIAELHRPIDKHTRGLLTVLEVVDDIALPGPADELGAPTLRIHGLCRPRDQAVYHVLEQQSGKSGNFPHQSRFIRPPLLRGFTAGLSRCLARRCRPRLLRW